MIMTLFTLAIGALLGAGAVVGTGVALAQGLVQAGRQAITGFWLTDAVMALGQWLSGIQLPPMGGA
jgi:hypothetical protein